MPLARRVVIAQQQPGSGRQPAHVRPPVASKNHQGPSSSSVATSQLALRAGAKKAAALLLEPAKKPLQQLFGH